MECKCKAQLVHRERACHKQGGWIMPIALNAALPELPRGPPMNGALHTTVWLLGPDAACGAAAAAAAAGEIMNNVMVEGQRLKFGPMVPKVRCVHQKWFTDMADPAASKVCGSS
jgi:hypothetical protein